MRRRTTDTGTVVLHFAMAGVFADLVGTGLRIAADDPESLWLRSLDCCLPSEHLWFRHLAGATILMAVLAGYVVYVRAARLTTRVRLDRARLMMLKNGGRARLQALNVMVYWTLMLALISEVVTGILLSLKFGGIVLEVHRDATFLAIGSVAVHIALHAASGGWPQILRILRPAPLVMSAPPPDLAALLAEQLARRRSEAAPATSPGRSRETTVNTHPMSLALVAVMLVGGLSVATEQLTRPVLEVAEISAEDAPVLDGDLSDPAWQRAKPVRVLTTQGGDFGGTHESLVEIRALHDGLNAYFAVTWEDPTRSLKHLPLVKEAGRWHLLMSDESPGEEARYHEDKFSLLFARPGFPLIGAAIHLGAAPLSDKPSSPTGRGLHFTTGGAIADVIQWRASHGGAGDILENAHFGEPATPGQKGADHYAGGFAVDPPAVTLPPNAMVIKDANGENITVPRRLPRDLAANARAVGRIVDADGQSDPEGARWWMTLSESVPYSPAGDALVPDGTIVPGVILPDSVTETPATVHGHARWAAGRWTLELMRRLHTGSPYDIPIRSGTLLWVAAFDHAEKRHTRHIRPFRLEVE